MKSIGKHMLIACAAIAGLNIAAFSAEAAQPGHWNGAPFPVEGTLVGSSPEPASAPAASWNGAPFPVEGTLLASENATDKIPGDPATGKRPGILDWAGSGMDVSQHPDGPGHDPVNCGICR